MIEKLRILDTTLRDGEQMPGVGYFPEEKLQIARQLREMNIKYIEAGFPVSSNSDFSGVSLIASELGKESDVVICGVARAVKKDIEIACNALESAYNPRIQVLMPASDSYIKHTLRDASHDSVIDMAGEMVSFARTLVEDVEFTSLDASRSQPKFLYKLLETAISAGATTLEIPDTAGYATPQDYGSLIQGIFDKVQGIEHAVVGTHCHDDLGLATANTLAGVLAGARQVECTINGLGERAGNASLEEVVMAIKTRPDIYPVEVAVNTTAINETSSLVREVSTVPVPPNKAIVGRNAFVHASGMHQQAMLQDSTTYQIIDPVSVGVTNFELTLDKLSGKHALRQKLDQLGVHKNSDEMDAIFEQFKDLAGKKKLIEDSDILNLVK